MNVNQLAAGESLSPDPAGRMQAWAAAYPWLQRAFEDLGPGARVAADRWRVRIEDELKATLDFKVRSDGTAAVWCGMSSYDFHHEPTPKELFEGLALAYQRELKRRGDMAKMRDASRPAQQRPKMPALVRALPPRLEESLTKLVAVVLLNRALQLVLIFLAVTALTLVLSAIAIAVH